ncbi:AMP-binding protein [Streptomyces melanosporofaciens]|uniref:Fatty-acyl-CoA synthase n=1 Tax=Streptomyces melanosporofaciens TaxID=67327 RepID=A0A1H4I937_STRMJ|nr:AMP-binding protein [Streptomyces melanosporofaciens]SEB30430.1 fatty-acyl-CoA synthase [Streptomyces melanosporofaciens]
MTSQAPASRTMGALLREMAARYGDRPAIAFEGRQISFAELDATVDRWARSLLACGIEQGQSVSVLAGNRPEWLYVAMASARIGAVLVPLNTWHRADELGYVLEHGDVKIAFCTDRLRSTDYAQIMAEAVPAATRRPSEDSRLDEPLLPCLERVIELGPHRLPGAETLRHFLARAESVPVAELHAAEAAVSDDDLLYLIYTSGSTARPKGVLLEHGHLIDNTFHIGERQGITCEDRSFLATPLFYGLGLLQAVGATWTHGGCVVLMEVYEPGAALRVLESERCTAFYGLGNMTRSLVEHPAWGKHRINLTKGVLGLTPVDKSLAHDALGLTHGTAIYGLTESYGLCAAGDRNDSFERARDTIGRPLPGWDIKVADPVTDEELSQGAVGQVLIRGHATRGYHKDPQRNKDTFTSDGYFRTGDLASFTADGDLVFHSRLSEMMKPGGINVSPLEVELIIARLDAVREVHVVGVPHPQLGDRIVAFVDADPERLSAEDVTRHVRSAAAKYKTPHHVIFRDAAELPRVASGKVPKAALREIARREIGLGL